MSNDGSIGNCISQVQIDIKVKQHTIFSVSQISFILFWWREIGGREEEDNSATRAIICREIKM